MSPSNQRPGSLRRLILDNYKAAGYPSVAALGRALAAARGQEPRSGVRSLRRYTEAEGRGIGEANAVTLASLLKLDPERFAPFVTQRHAGAEAAQIEELEARVKALESALRELRRARRGTQGGTA